MISSPRFIGIGSVAVCSQAAAYSCTCTASGPIAPSETRTRKSCPAPAGSMCSAPKDTSLVVRDYFAPALHVAADPAVVGKACAVGGRGGGVELLDVLSDHAFRREPRR